MSRPKLHVPPGRLRTRLAAAVEAYRLMTKRPTWDGGYPCDSRERYAAVNNLRSLILLLLALPPDDTVYEVEVAGYRLAVKLAPDHTVNGRTVSWSEYLEFIPPSRDL